MAILDNLWHSNHNIYEGKMTVSEWHWRAFAFPCNNIFVQFYFCCILILFYLCVCSGRWMGNHFHMLAAGWVGVGRGILNKSHPLLQTLQYLMRTFQYLPKYFYGKVNAISDYRLLLSGLNFNFMPEQQKQMKPY